MSLQNLATQMAAQGRGPDRTLVHMSPKEVQGLQALAMANGGSLTINPVTGLPEAGFLENMLPAIAGFALNAFAPGVGTAVGGLFGLGEAAGTALTVGGISGLASGSLEKGIMAGMGAYGGAGLGQSLGDMGSGVNARAANAAFDTTMPNLTDTERVAAIQAASKPDIGTGFSAAAKAPMDFLKDNKMNLALLAAPILMDSFGNKDSGPEANPSPGYIRTMKRDPVTGRIYQESAIPTGEFGNQSVGTYGGVPSRSMAEGGSVDENAQVAYDTRTDSQKSFDYLMGKPGSTNPMLFKKSTTSAIRPADMLTRTGGRYVLDAATNTYVWVPDAVDTAGLAAAAEKARLEANKGGGGGGKGDRDHEGNNSGYNPSITGLTVDENGNVVPENAKALSFLSMVPIVGTFAAAHLAAKEQEAREANVAVDSARSNSAMAVNPMSQDPSQMGIADGSLAAQQAANQAMTDAANAQATKDAIAAGGVSYTSNPDGSLSPTGGGYAGVDTSGRSDGPNGPEGRGEPGGDRGGWGSGGGYAHGGITALAGGGLGSLGGYSDGGQLLRGPGDGVSDSIPARIGRKQPARLADGEFVVPARIVSELGNGSTEAGARQLYKMLDRIQAGRKKTVGKNKTAVNSKSTRYLPA